MLPRWTLLWRQAQTSVVGVSSVVGEAFNTRVSAQRSWQATTASAVALRASDAGKVAGEAAVADGAVEANDGATNNKGPQVKRNDCPIYLQSMEKEELVRLPCLHTMHRNMLCSTGDGAFRSICHADPMKLANQGRRKGCLRDPERSTNRCKYQWIYDGWICSPFARVAR